MVSVGNRVRLSLNKEAGREGVVTKIAGSMLRVRWASHQETTVIHGPGTLTVLGTTRKEAQSRGQSTLASKKTATKKTASKSPPAKGASGTKKGRGRQEAIEVSRDYRRKARCRDVTGGPRRYCGPSRSAS